MDNRHPVTAILVGGLLAGTIDIGAASLISMLSPVFILHVVASGLIGRDAAFSGGLQTAALGMVLQWAMSLVIAAVYVTASGFLPALTRRWVTFGLLYGVGIYIVMNFVVVPLSALHAWPHLTARSVGLNGLAMLLFGLIVSYFAHRFGRSSARIPDSVPAPARS
jgi:uncharacterized membrane protein YagU involved in acid resistance